MFNDVDLAYFGAKKGSLCGGRLWWCTLDLNAVPVGWTRKAVVDVTVPVGWTRNAVVDVKHNKNRERRLSDTILITFFVLRVILCD
jgi:hypothetical protein